MSLKLNYIVLGTLLNYFIGGSVSQTSDRSPPGGYFHSTVVRFNWKSALQLCQSKAAKLPVIRSKDDQQNLEKYLSFHGINSSVWTSAKKNVFDVWKWNNGSNYGKRNSIIIQETHVAYTHVRIDQDLRYRTGEPRHKAYYICQYSGNGSCPPRTNYSAVNSSCLEPSQDDKSWYYARNHCLEKGGDLAVFDGANLTDLRRNGLKLKPSNSYWIGLRNYSWNWVSDESEVKYTNWHNETQVHSGNCSVVDGSTGTWKAMDCEKGENIESVICQGGGWSTTDMEDTSTASVTTESAFRLTEESTLREGTSEGHTSESDMERTSIASVTTETVPHQEEETTGQEGTKAGEDVTSAPVETTRDAREPVEIPRAVISDTSPPCRFNVVYFLVGFGVVVLILICVVIVTIRVRKSESRQTKKPPRKSRQKKDVHGEETDVQTSAAAVVHTADPNATNSEQAAAVDSTSGPTGVGTTADEPTEVGPTEVGPTEVGLTADEPTEVGPTEVGPTEVGPTEVGPTADESTVTTFRPPSQISAYDN